MRIKAQNYVVPLLSRHCLEVWILSFDFSLLAHVLTFLFVFFFDAVGYHESGIGGSAAFLYFFYPRRVNTGFTTLCACGVLCSNMEDIYCLLDTISVLSTIIVYQSYRFLFQSSVDRGTIYAIGRVRDGRDRKRILLRYSFPLSQPTKKTILGRSSLEIMYE